MAPEGVSASRLAAWLSENYGAAGEALFEWISSSHPAWGRQLAERADTISRECAKADGL